jgi:hypothetical protein
MDDRAHRLLELERAMRKLHRRGDAITKRRLEATLDVLETFDRAELLAAVPMLENGLRVLATDLASRRAA